MEIGTVGKKKAEGGQEWPGVWGEVKWRRGSNFKWSGQRGSPETVTFEQRPDRSEGDSQAGILGKYVLD